MRKYLFPLAAGLYGLSVSQLTFSQPVLFHEVEHFIFNGSPIDIADASYQVALTYQADDGEYFVCGGSLIERDWVVTAAHCVDGAGSDYVPNGVRVGSASLVDGRSIRIPIRDRYINPGYDTRNYPAELPKHDIALLRLDVDAPEHLNTLNLADDLAFSAIGSPGDPVQVAGWGATTYDVHENPTDLSVDQLLFAEMEVMSNQACESALGIPIREYQICAASRHDDGQGTCSGDSGGAITATLGSSTFAMGVLSGGVQGGCDDQTSISVFTRSSPFLGWIDASLADRYYYGHTRWNFEGWIDGYGQSALTKQYIPGPLPPYTGRPMGGSSRWYLHSGYTPSSGTGPSTGALQTEDYVYFETSAEHANSAGDDAILWLGRHNAPGFTVGFSYYMFGVDVGDLILETRKAGGDDSWTPVWEQSGQVQESSVDQWKRVFVAIESSEQVELRFRAVAKGGYRGDIALDELEIYRDIK